MKERLLDWLFVVAGILVGLLVLNGFARADEADPIKGMKAVMWVVTVNVNTLDIEGARALFFKSEADCEAAMGAVELETDHTLGPDDVAKVSCAQAQEVSGSPPAQGTAI